MVSQTVYVDRTTEHALLISYKIGTSFRYRSLFRPVPEALDTFYSAYHSARAKTVKEIGNRVATLFIVTSANKLGRRKPPYAVTYPEVCTWYGALTFAKVSGNQKMMDQLTRRFEPFLGKDSSDY